MDREEANENNNQATDFEEYINQLKENLLTAFEMKKKIDYDEYCILLKKAFNELYNKFR